MAQSRPPNGCCQLLNTLNTLTMVAQLSPSRYEEKTQAIAQQLLADSRPDRSFFSQIRDQMRWDDKLLAWAMDNPHLRVQLFHLIDCLPSLRSKAEIARHLQEYLLDSAVELPGALKNLLKFTQPDSIPGQLAATTFSTAVETLAHRYIAGETLKQVIKTIEGLRKDKMAFTLDLLGEAVITELEAQSYLDRYLDMMDQLATAAQKWSSVPTIDQADGQTLPRVQVSVKLTAFYSQFDPLDPSGSAARVGERIRILLRRAQELGVAVHFDMEQYSYKAITLSILKDLLTEPEFSTRTDIGITLQAYLRDSCTDLEDLIRWAKLRGHPITVRLIKGAYWDQETIISEQKHWPQPVYNHKASTDANFERMTELLLENHTLLYAAIGSHNVRSQAHAIAVAESLNVPRRAFELQVLYGMADRLAKALVQTGHRVRIYCPYGDLIPGMSYLIRRLLENTANSSFLRQNLEGVASDQLLSPPQFADQSDDQIKHTAPHPNLSNGHKPLDLDHSPIFQAIPDRDFSNPDQRQPFFNALKTVRQQLGQSYWPLINGERIETIKTLDSVNPSQPGELIGEVGLADVTLAQKAIEAAQAAFPAWRKTPASERCQIIRRVANLIEQKREELAAWMVLEVGKPLRHVDGEISEGIDFLQFYADEMDRLSHPRHRDVAGEMNYYHYQPKGIAVVISPWNFSASIPMGMTCAALVAGNCAILKPAEQSSVVAAKLSEILVEAGIPPGVFQFLPGIGEEIGPYLVKHPHIHLIAFTGSQTVGCQIYVEAAKVQPGQRHMKRVIAEMGGKNAIMVDESADLDQAIKGVVTSAYGYSGQKCSACSRVIVLDSIYDIFLQRLVEATRSLNVGPAEDPATWVGPVIDAEARDRIQGTIETAKTHHQVAIEVPTPETGYFVGPIVFSDVDPQSDLAQWEIFGPVLAVIRAQTFDQALQIANDTDYGLTGGIYSRTPSHIERAKAEFAVGNLYINRDITGAIVDRQPFGGFKLSGIGSKTGGPDYLLQFMEPRSVTENIQRQGFAPIEGVE